MTLCSICKIQPFPLVTHSARKLKSEVSHLSGMKKKEKITQKFTLQPLMWEYLEEMNHIFFETEK